jgi:signal transduction histidine kinase
VPLSRVRLRLAAWFALSLLAGLTLLDLSLYWYLRDQADRRLTRDLTGAAGELAAACRREYAEAPASGLALAAQNAVEEWPAGAQAVAIYDGDGRVLARGGPARLSQLVPGIAPGAPRDVRFADDESAARLVPVVSAGQPRFTAMVAGSTERLSEDDEALAWWLAVSAPIVAILSLVGGYVISRRALSPIGDLERAAAAIGPGRLDQRLPVTRPTDEIGRLAEQFNALLERLERSQAQTRMFLRRAAHQIRTPLTLILGESELGLERPRSGDEYRNTLGRVHRAAGQMQRRVEELFLLAQAEAGESIVLDAVVDLDGLALEGTDLMRARAQAVGRRLELERSDPVAVRGSAALLEEAVLELLENACRHSAPGATVAVSTFRDDRTALLAVSSEGDAPVEGDDGRAGENRGLGLPIVRWIAEQHGGRLAFTRHARRNTYALMLPVAAP